MISALTRSNEYKEKLKDISLILPGEKWEIKDKYPFTFFIHKEQKLLNQGWKIHISCLGKEIHHVLDLVIDVLSKEKVSFKVVSTYEDILRFNSGEAGQTQIGKIFTIYPHSTEHAYQLGKQFDEIWNSSSAPSPPSDLYFNPSGNVSLRYGAINNLHVITHHDNMTYPALVNPDGKLVPDISTKTGEQISWAPKLPGSFFTNGYFGKELDFLTQITNNRYTVVYHILKKTFTGTFLCMDLTLLKPVLVKVYYKRTDENKDGYTIIDSGRNEEKIARYLSKASLAPQVLDTYENEYFYFVIYEYIVGNNYAALPKEKRLQKLPLLLQKVQQMHDLGIVHRDLKLANIMCKDEDLFFVDFELSTTTGTIRPLQSGTKNHTPPEQGTDAAYPSYDCYSLGSCLIHAYVGIDPAAMPTKTDKRLETVASYIPNKTLQMIRQLYSTDPTNRPNAAECIEQIIIPAGTTVKVPAHLLDTIPQKTDMLIDQCLLSLEKSAKRDGKNIYWESTHNTNVPHMAWGLNTGVSGKTLGLLAITDNPAIKPQYRALAEKAVGYIKNIDNIQDIPPGLFTGLAGSALCLSAAYHKNRDKELLDKSYELLFKAGRRDCDYDLFAGYAGIAYVAVKTFRETGKERFLKIADECVEILMRDYDMIDGVTSWVVNRQEQEPRYETGVAHGSSGIAFVIALYSIEKRSERHFEFATRCFKEIFNNACSKDRKCLVHSVGVKVMHPAPNNTWCHGLAGLLWALIQIPETFNILQEEIEWAISICSSISHISNPTYCHGMAGSVELWRLVNATRFSTSTTQDCYKNALYELTHINQQHEGFELFSSEESESFSPDLWVGYAGSVSALAMAKNNSKVSILNVKW